MSARLFVDQALSEGADIALPAGAARHVQVLRLQPGAGLRLFDGRGGEFEAVVRRIGRSEVVVGVGAHHAVDRELGLSVTLALGMPANERMDALIEKATELGVAAIVPLMCERSVLRLHGERAERKLAHWRGVAVAACEQCGRTRLPALEPVSTLPAWLQALPEPEGEMRWLLSPREAPSAASVHAAFPAGGRRAVRALSGPEGGFSAAEELLALRHGFTRVGLGPRVLRADTAPLALLAWLALQAD